MIYIYIETRNGKYIKSAFEVITYAKQLAISFKKKVIAVTINAEDKPEKLYKYGVSEIINIKNKDLNEFNPKIYASLLDKYIDKDTSYIIFPHSENSCSIAPFLSIKRNIPYITQVTGLPLKLSPFTVKRICFSGKAEEYLETESNLILTLSLSCIMPKENPVQGIEQFVNAPILEDNHYKVNKTEFFSRKKNLKDANIVISGGMGMQGPENWNILTDLADTLNGALACTKPVSDNGWRAHEEHVGQTGTTIAPELYIAVGISGAIQHLSGMMNSKKVLVINKDPNAPFFKFADYGIIGDLFEVLPKLTHKIKEYKEINCK